MVSDVVNYTTIRGRRKQPQSRVKGRVVSVIDLGHADRFLMNSLKENLEGVGSSRMRH